MSKPTYISPSRADVCVSCSEAVMRTRTSASVIYCRTCRQAGLAPSNAKHGTDFRYRQGCRCRVCIGERTQRAILYRARRADSGNPVKRTGHEMVCRHCRVAFLGRVGQEFCSAKCARDIQGHNPQGVTRFRISRKSRLNIYERDGWCCTLCREPVDTSVDWWCPNAPTLDHIQPRSRGGSDDISNLRLACRDCNVRRSSNTEWVFDPSVRQEVA